MGAALFHALVTLVVLLLAQLLILLGYMPILMVAALLEERDGLMQRARVDLPAPLGPTTAVMERSGTCSDSPFSTALSRPSAVR